MLRGYNNFGKVLERLILKTIEKHIRNYQLIPKEHDKKLSTHIKEQFRFMSDRSTVFQLTYLMLYNIKGKPGKV